MRRLFRRIPPCALTVAVIVNGLVWSVIYLRVVANLIEVG